MAKIMFIMMLAFLLVGCSTTNTVPVTPKPIAMTQLMAAQCRVFERAFKATKQQSGQTKYSIVEGCPDYQNVNVIRNQFSEAGLFLSAASTATPAHVKQSGAAGVRLFQAMLSRGVSAKIASETAKSPAFKVAVNVANS